MPIPTSFTVEFDDEETEMLLRLAQCTRTPPAMLIHGLISAILYDDAAEHRAAQPDPALHRHGLTRH